MCGDISHSSGSRNFYVIDLCTSATYLSAVGAHYHTVVELPEFVRSAEKAGMDESDREELINLLAVDPDAGVSLGGGLYKVRFARKGEGKSGGYRVIYFFRDEELPVFLLTAYAKNQQENISRKAREAFLIVCKAIVEDYGADDEQG